MQQSYQYYILAKRVTHNIISYRSIHRSPNIRKSSAIRSKISTQDLYTEQLRFTRIRVIPEDTSADAVGCIVEETRIIEAKLAEVSLSVTELIDGSSDAEDLAGWDTVNYMTVEGKMRLVE
jgi:hypothetical protein